MPIETANSGCSSRFASQMNVSGMANRQIGEPAYWKIFGCLFHRYWNEAAVLALMKRGLLRPGRSGIKSFERSLSNSSRGLPRLHRLKYSAHKDRARVKLIRYTNRELFFLIAIPLVIASLKLYRISFAYISCSTSCFFLLWKNSIPAAYLMSRKAVSMPQRRLYRSRISLSEKSSFGRFV